MAHVVSTALLKHFAAPHNKNTSCTSSQPRFKPVSFLTKSKYFQQAKSGKKASVFNQVQYVDEPQPSCWSAKNST
jgi:hypothetical protein